MYVSERVFNCHIFSLAFSLAFSFALAFTQGCSCFAKMRAFSMLPSGLDASQRSFGLGLGLDLVCLPCPSS
jgi:hypothetical protein